MRRVVVTGLGAITPIGLNVDEFWNGIKESKLGFAEITKFDASEYKAHLAAEVKGFVGKEHMDFKAAKRMELFSQYAVAAAREALEDAGLDIRRPEIVTPIQTEMITISTANMTAQNGSIKRFPFFITASLSAGRAARPFQYSLSDRNTGS